MSTRSERFDWSQAHQQLEKLADALESAGRMDPAAGRRVMEQRARELARGGEKTEDVERGLDVVRFALNQERFALETRFVQEVLRVGDVTPLPGAPSFVTGVMNLRGEILPLIDLRLFFQLPVGELGETARIMVLGEKRPEVGVVVDRVAEVSTLRQEQVHPAPGPVGDAAPEFLLGVTPDALLILDGEALLNDPQLIIDEAD